MVDPEPLEVPEGLQPASGTDLTGRPGHAPWMDVAAAALLSLAAVASAWSSFQAGLWNSRTLFAFMDTASVNGERTASQAVEATRQAAQAGLLVEYLRARFEGKDALASFLLDRTRPEIQSAVKDWERTRPVVDPDAPRTPFDMPGYVDAANATASRFDELYAEAFDGAVRADGYANRYLAVISGLAWVLFFAGMASRFGSRRVNAAMLVTAAGVLALSLVFMFRLPITWP